MKVLVTGGTGVIGQSTVRELSRRGHSVRVISRHAGRGESWWPAGVEGWAGDLAQEATLQKSAEGCDVVIHIAGIVQESPPNRTFQRINIDGTRWIVAEAERSGVQRFVYVSSLGADRGKSAYHKSKCVAEDVVRGFTRSWVVLRPGAVYGPGDEHISMLLRMVRTLPVVPTIGSGNQQFQPIWHEDFARALAIAAERTDLERVSLDVAGPDLTSQNDLIARLQKITGRFTVPAPVPEIFATWTLQALDAVGVTAPFNEAQIAMLTEGNFIPAGGTNALGEVFGVAPTHLADGLARLANEQPEQLPSDGVGELIRKRYSIDIDDSQLDADALFEYVRDHLDKLVPAPITMSPARLEEGVTLTLRIPVRGQVQVRVGEVADRRVTLLTLAGHPIAGAVRFFVEPRETSGSLGFKIEVYERPATVFDELVLRTAGEWLQRATWIGLAQNVAKASGGRAGSVQTSDDVLDEHERRVVDQWATALVGELARHR